MRKDATDKKHRNLGIRSLYISYDGILEPLGQSQIIPYLKELSKKDIDFILVTYEKKRYLQNKEMFEMLSRELKYHNIKWLKLNYHKKPLFFSTLFDGLIGLIVCIYIVLVKKPVVIHSRAYVPALIGLILKKVFRIKFIFDMRGFWADERVDGGIWKKKGALYSLVKYLEKSFLRSADWTVVLSQKAKDFINTVFGLNENISLISCATDVEKFKFDLVAAQALRKKYSLEGKLIFVHTGSLEGWYLIEEMLDFFKVAKCVINRAHFLVLTHSDKAGFNQLISERRIPLDDFTIISVPQNEMPAYLSVANVGLFFLKRSFSMKAASPTKFAEYLSCGLPVITNGDIGDIDRYILTNHIGIIVTNFQDKSYREASQKIVGLLNGEQIRQRCRKVAIDNFSLTSATNKYYELYWGLSDERRS